MQRGIETALFGARGRGDGIVGRAVKDADVYNAGVRPLLSLCPRLDARNSDDDVLPPQVQQVPHTATSTERSGVLYDVRRLLALRTEAPPASDPTAEANNQSQIVALKKLESLILNTQLTTEQVNQIRAQLKALTPAPAPVPSPSPAPPAPVAAAEPAAASLTPQLLAPTAPSHTHGPSPSPSFAPAADSTSAPPAPSSLVGGIDLGLLSQLSASGALANLFAPGASPAPSSAASGAVKLEDAPGQAHAHAHGQVKAEENKPQVKELGGADKDEMARGWEDEILRLNVGLTNAEVAACVLLPLSLHAVLVFVEPLLTLPLLAPQTSASSRLALVPRARAPLRPVRPALLCIGVGQEEDGSAPRLALQAQAARARGGGEDGGQGLVHRRGGASLPLSLSLSLFLLSLLTLAMDSS